MSDTMDRLTLEDLLNRRVWLCWREERRNGAITKVPYQPRQPGAKASTADATHRGTFDEAEQGEAVLRASGAKTGIGLAMGCEVANGLVLGGVDIDQRCHIAQLAKRTVDRLDSYTETSPSGTGQHVFFLYRPEWLPRLRAELDWPGERDKAGQRQAVKGQKAPEIVVYFRNSYLTLSEQWETTALRLIEYADLRCVLGDIAPQVKAAHNVFSLSDKLRALVTEVQPVGSRSDDFMAVVAHLHRDGWQADEVRDLFAVHANTGVQAKYAARLDEELTRVWDKLTPAAKKPTKLPEFLTLDIFIRGLEVPDYLVQGIIQSGRLQALTAPTHHGKTAVGMAFGFSIAGGRAIGTLRVKQGTVLYLCGENADDNRMRAVACCEAYGMATSTPLVLMAERFPLTQEAAEELRERIDASGIDPVQIQVDTGPAFFPGEDANDNKQQGDYARFLRTLTRCKRRPNVLVHCHPLKRAGRDDLQPKGGGDFLNELDSNLTLWSAVVRETTTLHWQAKHRGPEFEPVHFRFQPVKLAGLVDSEGEPIWSVVAEVQSDAEAAGAAKRYTEEQQDVLLLLFDGKKDLSIADMASALGWFTGSDPQPYKSKVHRVLETLMADKLVTKRLNHYRLTKAGKDEAKLIEGRENRGKM